MNAETPKEEYARLDAEHERLKKEYCHARITFSEILYRTNQLAMISARKQQIARQVFYENK